MTITDAHDGTDGACLTGTVQTGSGMVGILFHSQHDDLGPGQRIRVAGEARPGPDGGMLLADPEYAILEDVHGSDEDTEG